MREIRKQEKLTLNTKCQITLNTCRLRAKGEGEKGEEKTFNPYPLTFSPNQIPT
ncbi:hypothetical protein FDUTEX481_07320 [Tolypothrix sp. PCC 7601]|nr:hypothetical protein FDUTEX481_07320 [Tolypothrix sp. PCC 7601]